MWEARNIKRDFAPMSLDFLLLDEKDCVIQGSIPVKHIEQFKEYITEGEVFEISNFDVVRSSDRYKMTDHDYMIHFKDETTIKKPEAKHCIQHEKFRLRGFKELSHLANKGKELPDVIGFVCNNLPHLEDSIHGSSKRVIVHLLLEDGAKVRVTLWDRMVDAFYDKLSRINVNTIVIIVTGVNPKYLGSDLYLNTTSSTKFYLNSDFDIERQFRKRMNFEADEIVITRDECINTQSRTTKNISEILEFVSQDKKQEAEFWCQAQVKDIVLRNGWNYIACSVCGKKIEKTGTTLACGSCKKAQAVGILRFRIEVLVDDGSATTKFVIFDREAKKLINKEASDVRNEEDAAEDKNGHQSVPECIRSIIGRTLNFQIKVTSYNFTARFQSFTVSRVFDGNKAQIEKDVSGKGDNTEGRKRDRETDLKQKALEDTPKTKKNIDTEMPIDMPNKSDVAEEEKTKEWKMKDSEKQAAQNKKIKKEDITDDTKYPSLMQ